MAAFYQAPVCQVASWLTIGCALRSRHTRSLRCRGISAYVTGHKYIHAYVTGIKYECSVADSTSAYVTGHKYVSAYVTGLKYECSVADPTTSPKG